MDMGMEGPEAQGDSGDITEGPAVLGDTTEDLVGREGPAGITVVLGEGFGSEEGIGERSILHD